MADGVVSFALENVGKILIEEGKLLSGVRHEVEDMQTELRWMQGFLIDAERRKGESHMVGNWVSEIREAAYDLEDLIEHFFLKSALRNQKGAVKKYASFMNHPVEIHQVGSRIKDIKGKLTTLRTRLQTYGIKELKVGGEEVVEASATSRRKRQDFPHVPNYNVFGLDKKISELVQHLLDDQKEPVVYLYGMGGLGKTTTAKQVYKNDKIKAYFGGVAWVYISQQFNPEQVWKSILTQLSTKNKEEVERMSTDELTSQLFQLQKKKRCLVVIDDIWRQQDWDILSPAFPYTDGDNKSKILLTSRNRDAVVSGRVYRTSLDILDDRCSLDLLKNTILSSLGGRDTPMKEDSKMPNCAEKMIKQCGGLPLAIIVLGGILATKHESQWEKVGANIKSVLKRREQEGKGDGVSSVLESSYKDLSYYLRSCFLYFSQYREDEEIKTTKLKHRWIAEGFVPSLAVEGDETMEDIAEEYLDELVRRCMIQVGREGHTGRVKTCRMHDLMRELSISKAREEGFAHTVKLGAQNEGTNFEKISFRRLCISSGNHEQGDTDLSSLRRISPELRSIRFEDNLDDDQCKEVGLVVKKLKSVRVLGLPSTMGKTKSGRRRIGNLIHLRFLDLEVSMLPSSIGNLICLQTLNLGRCDSFLKIPDSVWRMEKLRHLYLPKGGGVCESAKQLVGVFKNLQTLVNFPPEKFDIEQNLVKFINVRKLVITDRCEEICKIIRGSPGMVFDRLESLFIKSSEKIDMEAVTRSCPSLRRLVVFGRIKLPEAPSCSTVIWPSKLTKVVLRDSGLDESHMRSLGKLQRLKVLFLYGNALTRIQMIFQENDFAQLHHLLVEQLKNLRLWAVHKGGLPSLCCLEIVNCRELESVPDGFQYLKQLKELKVTSMPYLFRKKLEKGGQDWERVRHVPSISFSNCYGAAYDPLLDESSSLELLKKTILSSGGPDHPIREYSKMDTSGILEMVKVCKGVQVAITILGGILARKKEIEEWEGIKSVLKEGELKGNEAVTSLLQFCYEDLPCNLKPCFLYFSQCPTREVKKTSEIIQTWIGEGFVTSSMEDVGMGHLKEDVGREYLNELVSRGLIQVEERSHRGRVKACRMHPFVRDFCVSKAKEESFALSLHQLPGKLWSLDDWRERARIGNDVIFLQLEVPELPKFIGNLRCMQTLNLVECTGCKIPDSVWGMEQLKHLYLPRWGGACESRRPQVGDFLNLQTLVNFPPDDFDLQQNLVKFSNVRKLAIRNRWVGEMGRILRSQGIVFNRLQSLSFMERYADEPVEEMVDLEAFTRGSLLCLYRLVVNGSIKFPTAPSCTSIWPPNLTKLVLFRTNIDQSQLGSLGKLQSLQVLFLYDESFAGKEMVFHTNDFPQLHHLMIEALEHLETWAVHEGALSNLLCLEIVCCKELKSVPDGCQYLKQLKDLKISRMPYRFTDRLEEGGEDWDRVSHVPSISFFHCG